MPPKKARKKKQPDFLDAVGSFLKETGLDKDLKQAGADFIRQGIHAFSNELNSTQQLPPAPEQYERAYNFQPRARPERQRVSNQPPPPPPPDPNDPYVILNVPRDMATDEIEAVMRRRSHRMHPDKGGDEEQFKQMWAAWELIKKERGV